MDIAAVIGNHTITWKIKCHTQKNTKSWNKKKTAVTVTNNQMNRIVLVESYLSNCVYKTCKDKSGGLIRGGS